MNTPSYRLQPPRPAWGIRVPPRKRQSMQRPIFVLPPPARVRIPVDLGPRGAAQPVVGIGEQVLTGQLIANTEAGLGVHASISGRVAAIGRAAVPGPEGIDALCIDIEGDGEDHWHPDCAAVNGEPAPQEIIARIASAGIVGLGGALFPTAEKLRAGGPVQALILNGAECEPYISCDEMLLRGHSDTVLHGVRLMMRALDAPRAVIAVESDMPEARVALYDAITAAGYTDIDVAVVTAKYPAGGERQLIELLAEQEVRADGLPRDTGYVCQNVATAAAVADLFEQGRPLISRIVTVTGGGVARPVNVEARIGTPLDELLEAAGGLTDASASLIMGGPMMGFQLPHAQLPVTKATNCLLVTPSGELNPQLPEYPCIRCGECSEVCPARLLPQDLLSACRGSDIQAMASLRLEACIECGCCDYVCPSHIKLTPRFIAGKALLDAAAARSERATLARQRSEARDRRLAGDAAREAVEAARLDAAVTAGVNPQAAEAELQALLARVARPENRDDEG